MRKLYPLILLAILLVSCGSDGQQGQEQADYEQTKKMVVDILQTEDGKKSLREILNEEEFKQELTIQSDTVKSSINETLVSDKGKEMWKSLFEDPSFVKGYTEAIQEEQTKWLKDLLKDSEYQEQMLELLQNPEISEMILSLIKSQQFRSHLETTIQETLQTPTFQARIQEILLQAAEEQSKQQEQGGGGSEESGGSGESGSESGGESGEESGGGG
jgi:spore germination protein D